MYFQRYSCGLYGLMYLMFTFSAYFQSVLWDFENAKKNVIVERGLNTLVCCLELSNMNMLAELQARWRGSPLWQNRKWRICPVYLQTRTKTFSWFVKTGRHV